MCSVEISGNTLNRFATPFAAPTGMAPVGGEGAPAEEEDGDGGDAKVEDQDTGAVRQDGRQVLGVLVEGGGSGNTWKIKFIKFNKG